MVGKQILHYRVLEELGRGGMGVVYKALDTELNRDVAIKFLPSHIASNEEERQRFKVEAQAAAALNHPNIGTIYSIEKINNETFISMEFIEGQELKEKIESGPLTIDETLILAIQISKGLQAAHEKGVVHRDIKSANIMLTDKGDVKIMDFGLAKVRGGPKLTKEQSTLGTAAYMSPEQASGEEVDFRSDIFSLGVLLYEMLTGQLPFKGDYDQAVTYSVLHEDPEPITGLRTGIPMEFERIVNKCLKKDVAGRYQHATELIADLSELKKESEAKELLSRTGITQSQPLQKKPQQTQFNKFRAIFILVGFLLLITTVGLVYFFSREEPINSIAVLPFVNSNNDPDIDYLSDGLAETLINKLSQLPQLRVMARSTAFQFKGKEMTPQQIGNELGVRAILTGDIVQRGDALRFHVELVDVSDGTQIWGDQYNRTMADIFDIQNAIAEQISSKLQLKLGSVERDRLVKRYTNNSEAYQLYLKGRFHWNLRTGEDLQTAVEYFEQAIHKDPNYALAYAGIADCYVLFSWYSVQIPEESFPKAKEAALKALQLDSQLAEPHTALAQVYSNFDWDWISAEKSYKRSFELNPNYATAHQWYGEDLVFRGRYNEAIAEFEKALTLDPLSPIITAAYGYYLGQAGYHDRAIQQLQKVVELDQRFHMAQHLIGGVYIIKGDFARSVYHLQEAFRLDNDPIILGSLGYALAISGETEEANRTIDQMNELASKRYVSPYFYAIIYAGLDNNEKAFEYLLLCVEQRSNYLIQLNTGPFFNGLRSDPRFDELLKTVGLVE